MKKLNLLLLTVFALTLTWSVNAQNRKERKVLYASDFNYEIQCLGVGNDGTKLVKVWGYGKKAQDAIYNAKRNSVAAAIFRGIPAGGGAAPTPAICRDANSYEKHNVFFDTFFDTGGKYLQFINMTNDGNPSGNDRIKMKKGYKVAVIASVDFESLKKYLQQEGVAKSLSSGF